MASPAPDQSRTGRKRNFADMSQASTHPIPVSTSSLPPPPALDPRAPHYVFRPYTGERRRRLSHPHNHPSPSPEEPRTMYSPREAREESPDDDPHNIFVAPYRNAPRLIHRTSQTIVDLTGDADPVQDPRAVANPAGLQNLRQAVRVGQRLRPHLDAGAEVARNDATSMPPAQLPQYIDLTLDDDEDQEMAASGDIIITQVRARSPRQQPHHMVPPLDPQPFRRPLQQPLQQANPQAQHPVHPYGPYARQIAAVGGQLAYMLNPGGDARPNHAAPVENGPGFLQGFMANIAGMNGRVLNLPWMAADPPRDAMMEEDADIIPQIQLDYARHPFGAPAKPVYVPPMPPGRKSGFTRELNSGVNFHCPGCRRELDAIDQASELDHALAKRSELATKKQRAEHPLWVLRECGHTYCRRCYENRKKPQFTSMRRVELANKPTWLCAVQDCISHVSKESSWSGVYL